MDDGFGPPLLAAAAVHSGERVLDVGCGLGARSFDAAERVGPDGSVDGAHLEGSAWLVTAAVPDPPREPTPF